MAYRVMSVPTLTIFKGGQPVQSVAGAKPEGRPGPLHRVRHLNRVRTSATSARAASCDAGRLRRSSRVPMPPVGDSRYGSGAFGTYGHARVGVARRSPYRETGSEESSRCR